MFQQATDISQFGTHAHVHFVMLKVILSVYCVGESHNPTPQYVALT